MVEDDAKAALATLEVDSADQCSVGEPVLRSPPLRYGEGHAGGMDRETSEVRRARCSMTDFGRRP